jgi:hypothetical protein
VCSLVRQIGMSGGPYGGTVNGSDGGDVVPAEVARELLSLRAENARLLRLLKLSRREAAAPVRRRPGSSKHRQERCMPGRPPK